MSEREYLQKLAQRFVCEGVRAVGVTGSFARGEAGTYSDVDIIRLIDEKFCGPIGPGSRIIDERLVVVSDLAPTDVEKAFTEPKQATDFINGFRVLQPLLDETGDLGAIKERAIDFTWTGEMQQKANCYAGEELVGLIEEVHKGLEGLKRNDTGRLLNARFGLSWGLTGILKVQRGILLKSDNSFFEELAEALGPESEWCRLQRIAYGIEIEQRGAEPLRSQVIAGLRLYTLTFELVEEALFDEHKLLVKQTCDLIKKELSHFETFSDCLNTSETIQSGGKR